MSSPAPMQTMYSIDLYYRDAQRHWVLDRTWNLPSAQALSLARELLSSRSSRPAYLKITTVGVRHGHKALAAFGATLITAPSCMFISTSAGWRKLCDKSGKSYSCDEGMEEFAALDAELPCQVRHVPSLDIPQALRTGYGALGPSEAHQMVNPGLRYRLSERVPCPLGKGYHRYRITGCAVPWEVIAAPGDDGPAGAPGTSGPVFMGTLGLRQMVNHKVWCSGIDHRGYCIPVTQSPTGMGALPMTKDLASSGISEKTVDGIKFRLASDLARAIMMTPQTTGNIIYMSDFVGDTVSYAGASFPAKNTAGLTFTNTNKLLAAWLAEKQAAGDAVLATDGEGGPISIDGGTPQLAITGGIEGFAIATRDLELVGKISAVDKSATVIFEPKNGWEMSKKKKMIYIAAGLAAVVVVGAVVIGVSK